jgi:hypothetical protein
MNLVVDKNNNKNKNTDKNWWKYRKHPNKAKKFRNPLDNTGTTIEELLLSESPSERAKQAESKSEEFKKTAKLILLLLEEVEKYQREEEAKGFAE